jgi:hypothetical protein
MPRSLSNLRRDSSGVAIEQTLKKWWRV